MFHRWGCLATLHAPGNSPSCTPPIQFSAGVATVSSAVKYLYRNIANIAGVLADVAGFHLVSANEFRVNRVIDSDARAGFFISIRTGMYPDSGSSKFRSRILRTLSISPNIARTTRHDTGKSLSRCDSRTDETDQTDTKRRPPHLVIATVMIGDFGTTRSWSSDQKTRLRKRATADCFGCSVKGDVSITSRSEFNVRSGNASSGASRRDVMYFPRHSGG